MRKDDSLTEFDKISSDTLKKIPLIVPRQVMLQNDLADWLGQGQAATLIAACPTPPVLRPAGILREPVHHIAVHKRSRACKKKFSMQKINAHLHYIGKIEERKVYPKINFPLQIGYASLSRRALLPGVLCFPLFALLICTAALFIFFSAAARAGIIAAHPVFGSFPYSFVPCIGSVGACRGRLRYLLAFDHHVNRVLCRSRRHLAG